MNTLGQYRGVPCHHWDAELPLIEAVMREHKPKHLVELGTMHGGFALWLADLLHGWDGHVSTYDVVKYPEVDVALIESAGNLTFTQFDVLAKGAPEFIVSGGNPSFCVYADNGDKQKEMALYAPRMPRGSLFGVHDYTTEINHEWAEEFMHGLGFVQVHEDAFIEFNRGRNHVSRFWRRMS